MIFRKEQLSAGLYLVATPIGNARDITLRALDILASADVIAAEDTRTAKRLLEIHGVPLGGRHVIAYHDHSSPASRAKLVARIIGGESCAYVSEAGTPLISDPGFALGRDVTGAGGSVWAAPGASAVVTALTVAGLPTDRFYFIGFPPHQAGHRKSLWAELRAVPATVVFYESPNRISQSLAELRDTLGGERKAAICRELTKKFEEVISGTLDELVAALESRTVKGECVVVLDRGEGSDASLDDVDAALKDALSTMRMKDAATAVAGSFGLPRREVYARALEIAKDE